MKSRFELDKLSDQRIAIIVFERANGQRFNVETAPDEDVRDALQRFIVGQKNAEVCQVEILKAGELYRVVFPNGEAEDFTVIV